MKGLANEAKELLKGVDWKNGGQAQTASTDPTPDAGQPVKKRRPKKFRPIPDYYFLPRMSWPKTLAFYGTFIAGGIGAGMLLEVYMKKKMEDGDGVVWEFDK